MNYHVFIERCEGYPGWQHFVEDHWKKVIDRTASYVLNIRGRVKPDFLTVADEKGYSVVGSWGTIAMPRVDLIDAHDQLILDLDWWEIKDPQFGGLSKGEWNKAPDAANYLTHNPELAPLLDLKVSPTTISDAHMLFTVFSNTGIDLKQVDSLVQWGGGFGNHSRIMRTWGLKTEYVIDLPLASALQYEYLRNNFGEEAVHLVKSESDEVKEGRINLVPLPYRNVVPDGSMFMALHSLNESTPAAQDYVVHEKKWFGAKDCFLAWTPDLRGFDGQPFGPCVKYFDQLISTLDLKHAGDDCYHLAL